MARAGDAIHHPVTRERVIWRRVAADTGGELLQMDFVAEPGGFVAREHVHPKQTERFEVLSGALRMSVDGQERLLRAGDVAVVPPGHRHVWANAGEDEAHFALEFTPALRSETFFETWFGLGKDGKTDGRGMPNLLQLAVIFREFKHEIRAAGIPYPIQLALFAPLALIGRAVGFRARYPRYSVDPGVPK